MAMTNADIRSYYESHWREKSDAAGSLEGLRYSDRAQDAVQYESYERLIDDLAIPVRCGRVLDIGAGSGRWVRWLLETFRPARLAATDIAGASIELLECWFRSDEAKRLVGETALRFQQGNVGLPQFDLGEQFDLINVANVLFHIPEEPLHQQALANIAKHLAPTGRAVVTEFLPHAQMRTQWMLVRSRYQFRNAAERAGLRLIDVRPASFFTSEPCGVDGPDTPGSKTVSTRERINRVRASLKEAREAARNHPEALRAVNALMVDVERAVLQWAAERVPAADLPGQKLVVLGRA